MFETNNDEEFHVVFNNDLILLKIFNYLSIRQLNKVRQVCKKWKLLVEEILYCRDESILITLFRGSNWIYTNNTNKDLIISEKDFLKHFNKSLDRILIEPEVFVFFLSRSFFENGRCIIREYNRSTNFEAELSSRRRNLGYVTRLMSYYLPINAIQVIATNEGIISSDAKNYIEKKRGEILIKSSETSVENQYPDVIGTIQGIFLPKSNGLYRFSVKQLVNQSDKLLEVHNEGDMNKFFGVEKDESLRLIYIFVNDFYGRLDITLLKFLDVLNIIRSLNDYAGLINFVVCGSSTYYAFVNNSENDYTSCEEITFLTLISKNDHCDAVRVVQVTIPGIDEDEEEEDILFPGVDEILKEKLTWIQKTGITNIDANNKDMNIFAIYNTSRSSRVFGEINPEMKVFKEMFPNVPICGSINQSQISHDYFPMEENKFDTSKNNSNNYSHAEYDITYHRYSDAWDSNIDCSTFTVISLKTS